MPALPTFDSEHRSIKITFHNDNATATTAATLRLRDIIQIDFPTKEGILLMDGNKQEQKQATNRFTPWLLDKSLKNSLVCFFSQWDSKLFNQLVHMILVNPVAKMQTHRGHNKASCMIETDSSYLSPLDF